MTIFEPMATGLAWEAFFISWESDTTYSHWNKPGVNSKDSTKTTGLGSYIIPKGLQPYLLKNTRKLEGTQKRITIQEISLQALSFSKLQDLSYHKKFKHFPRKKSQKCSLFPSCLRFYCFTGIPIYLGSMAKLSCLKKSRLSTLFITKGLRHSFPT